MLVMFLLPGACHQRCGILPEALSMAGPGAVSCGTTNDNPDAAWFCATGAYESATPFVLRETDTASDFSYHNALVFDGVTLTLLSANAGGCPLYTTTEACPFVEVRASAEWLPNAFGIREPRNSDWIFCSSQDPDDSGFVP